MNRPFILFPEDIIQAGDFVRPLDLTYIGQSDNLMTESTYGGRPINHTRWITVERAGLQRWIGQSVKDLNDKMDSMWESHQYTSHYEFIRGDLPEEHQLPETKNEKEKRLNQKVIPQGKHIGKTLAWIKEHDGHYYGWMEKQDLVQKWCNV